MARLHFVDVILVSFGLRLADRDRENAVETETDAAVAVFAQLHDFRFHWHFRFDSLKLRYQFGSSSGLIHGKESYCWNYYY